MTVITGDDLRALLGQGLVEAMPDPELQEQMCGVELTLQRIESFESSGAVDFDNSQREVAKTGEIAFDQRGWVSLKPGAYLVTFNEIVAIPPDVTALARPRSSLLRSGATLATALWDPGYRGRSQSLLLVHNPHGLRLQRNARLLQLVFLRLGGQAGKVYSGAYQGENI
ncbi:MAG: deoxyuridine 5'-triphosphate nucleotidohydrolase [Methanosarcinales archaeon]|nr:deoxyuridine 5'-triphosphate nucleotidohydrolase [Methanosarcinales archaeon]